MFKTVKEKFYDFVISDFDGTIFNSRKEVSKETVDAINAFVDNGGVFCVCTGRMTASIIPLLKRFGIDRGYVITYNGAEICDIATGEKVFKNHIESENLVKILKYAEENGFEVLVYPNDQILVERVTQNNAEYMQMSSSSALVLAESVSEYVKKNNLTSGKSLFLTGGKEEIANKILAELKEVLGNEFTITHSNKYHVDIMKKSVSKGATIRKFAKLINKSLEKLICFGDEMNDESMIAIEEAVGAVPISGAEQLKNIADLIIDACDEDGVAKAIKKYCI